jgi:Na+/H+ antiporter NhaD/arsenite permease-like protein
MDITILLSIIFLCGYACIALESYVKVNKAAVALITGVLCWTAIVVFGQDHNEVHSELSHHLSEISSILFFLLGAMTIVELIDLHRGFDVITNRLQNTSGIRLLWLTGFLTFFLSSVLDNLTTTIVMVSLLRKIIPDHKLRLSYVSLVVIAANAGGAWTPIGDVTTTMLWIKGQITTLPVMGHLFLPSMACLLVPLVWFHLKMKPAMASTETKLSMAPEPGSGNATVLILGLGALLFVPVFKSLTGLPPYIAMLFGMSVIWVYTDFLSEKNELKKVHTISDALQKIDIPTVLFFLGILLSVASLEYIGLLSALAVKLNDAVSNQNIIVILIGIVSAIVDNVPLVAAAQGMYSMDLYPPDHTFWMMLAYCAGTGGSILIIGSAAGVAAMGKEKIDFIWYMKNISFVALLGYFAGIAVYMLQQYFIF